jgi:hypothetical protein
MDYLLKSSACYFVLWGFYKLGLENTSWHRFKRLFLLVSLVMAAVIPLIIVRTITVPGVLLTQTGWSEMVISDGTGLNENSTIKWELILWAVYTGGVLIMSIRFFRNLYDLRLRNDDEIHDYKSYVLVLRKLVVVPHSFFNKIYASITQYKSGAIPDAVLEHEKAHLDQKHSWDILFIELITILLWFNPLVYLLKFSIKLNHEFLADRSVLSKGQDARDYQRTLLTFAASSQNRTIANTFNFPIIKKRFTIMNTKTSPTSLLLRSLALIPVIALLVISCGKEDVEIEEVIEVIEIKRVTGDYWPDDKTIYIDSTKSAGSFPLHGKQYSYTSKNGVVLFKDPSGNSITAENLGQQVKYIEIIIEDILEAEGIDIIEVLEVVTSKDLTEYNRLAKKHKKYMDDNNSLIVWADKTARMVNIFYSMNPQQKAASEPWPYMGRGNDIKAGQIPPPPPPAAAVIPLNDEQGCIRVDGNIFHYTSKGANNQYYDHDGKLIDVKGKNVEQVDEKDLPPPPPPPKKSGKESKEISNWVRGFMEGFNS